MEYIFAALFIGAIGFLLWNGRKKFDVNKDGQVDKADAVAVVEKVEAAVVEEVKKVEAAVVEEVKKVKAKATAKAKAPAKKTAAKKTATKKSSK